MFNPSMVIHGRQVSSPDTFEVINPATGQVCGQVPDCTDSQLDEAMSSALQAQREWAVDADRRRSLLADCARLLTENLEDIARLLTTEQGKPINESRREVGAAAAWFGYYAALDLPSEVVQDDSDTYIEVTHEPLGVVAAITPWNYPILLASWKLAPALRAGNTVVLKPSPFTPMSSLLLVRTLAEILPPGVLNVITGRDELGPKVTSHPVPRKVSFTGSTQTGKRVAASAAATLKRVTLELGGNDAAIVLDDVDPAAIAEKLFWSAFINNGQTCIAIKRLYVPASRHEDYVSALAAIADSAALGDGALETTQFGPINNTTQHRRVVSLIDDAVSRGAKIVTNTDPVDVGAGFFHRPTILTSVSDEALVVAEEQFGPVLPVLPYETVDEVLVRANSTTAGLGGSVWGTDEQRASQIADQLVCGTAWVNTHAAPSPRAAFSGVKDSGLGVENGRWGLEAFTQPRTRYVARA
ncbi:aldehyde dehydrogenase family protein [Gordonia jinghuaiqii]|uniref:Aldehyde dehydrogenase family protein n=1 Tax=Gordonia jinghuaiqii TaxID=2758710 RepID=A0A7D7LY84_9ACTN|nr:aldehyde dehydrogenase family protein [Gordonia jinghuaiqii]MCR5978397.1 aldehyde dehydrogenase family protein [Gordonia jinghuaiqii]QMT02739.1 aldehyde dehydrogenase family protein [Gordonia jinghuaiqii]